MFDAKIDHLIIDSGGFIKGHSFNELGNNLYTLKEVIEEIKDRETKRRILALPYDIVLREPSNDSIKIVSDIAKKTGDYGHLSITDIKVLALTVEIHRETLNQQDVETVEDNQNGENLEDVELLKLGSERFPGFYMPSELEEANDIALEKLNISDESDHANDADLESGDLSLGESSGSEKALDCNQTEDYDHDDNVGWVTPENIKKIGRYGSQDKIKHHMKVACMTTDYSMQNILKQLKIDIVNPQGYLVRHVKTFILRCVACFQTTPDITRKFCPKCGNKTLRRVSVSYDEEGNMKMYLSKKPMNLRGTKFSLPMPKGGKHAVNPLLMEDQRLPHQRPSKRSLQRVDIFSPDFVCGSSPFTVHDIYSRAGNLGNCGPHHKAYWERRNPNERRHK